MSVGDVYMSVGDVYMSVGDVGTCIECAGGEGRGGEERRRKEKREEDKGCKVGEDDKRSDRCNTG